jgi:hypothetical protein
MGEPRADDDVVGEPISSLLEAADRGFVFGSVLGDALRRSRANVSRSRMMSSVTSFWAALILSTSATARRLCFAASASAASWVDGGQGWPAQ